MSFFDRKEDVLQVELTKHGRKLLSKGQFNPVYYSFHDDDVIYDGECAGLTEEQSDIEPRIFESIRLNPQPSFVGVDSTINLGIVHDRDRMPFGAALGTSESRAEHMPAWQVGSHFGSFVSASIESNIPQLYYEVEMRTKIGKRDAEENLIEDPPGHDFEGEEGISYLFNFESQTFPDGSYIRTEGEPLLLEIYEANVPDMKENWEIEVFWVNEMNGEERLFPLFLGQSGNLNVNDAEYFLNIEIDQEIEDRYLCEIGPEKNRTNIFIPRRQDCREYPPFEGDNEVTYINSFPDDGDIC